MNPIAQCILEDSKTSPSMFLSSLKEGKDMDSMSEVDQEDQTLSFLPNATVSKAVTLRFKLLTHSHRNIPRDFNIFWAQMHFCHMTMNAKTSLFAHALSNI